MEEKIKECAARLNETALNLSDQEIYALLTIVFNLLEQKNNSNDAIRKWMDDRQDEIILLLNGNATDTCFNRESFQLLFEYCFRKQEKILQNRDQVSSISIKRKK